MAPYGTQDTVLGRAVRHSLSSVDGPRAQHDIALDGRVVATGGGEAAAGHAEAIVEAHTDAVARRAPIELTGDGEAVVPALVGRDRGEPAASAGARHAARWAHRCIIRRVVHAGLVLRMCSYDHELSAFGAGEQRILEERRRAFEGVVVHARSGGDPFRMLIQVEPALLAGRRRQQRHMAPHTGSGGTGSGGTG
jgi:hypothetical protein